MSSSSSRNPSIRVWTCCKCHEAGVSMNLGDCPNCQESRCIDCDVKSRAATDAEVEEEQIKIARAAAQRDAGFDTGAPGRSRLGESSYTPNAASSDQITSQAPSLESNPALIGLHNFKIIPGETNDPIYTLRNNLDRALIAAWKQALPRIGHECLISKIPCASIHTFRMGPTERSSVPTIVFNTTEQLKPDATKLVHSLVSKEMYFALPEIWRDTQTIQIMIRQSRLRRSVEPPTLPPICEARNLVYRDIPESGDSIGMGGSNQDTATLGCYVVVGGKEAVLTVDHLVPEGKIQAALTHMAEQDTQDILVSKLKDLSRRLQNSTRHNCRQCRVDGIISNMFQCFSTMEESFWQYMKEIIPESTAQRCEIFEKLNIYRIELEKKFQSRYIGTFHSCSGRRARALHHNGALREMDWALFDLNPRLQSHFSMIGKEMSHPGVRHLSWPTASLMGGALVCSRGRTSGYQLGQISNTPSGICHGSYFTEEWTVIRRPGTPVDDWVKGGIGVEGDSGALIVDEKTHGVFGMLWGRIGEGATTVTIFTPLEDIVDDVEEKTGLEVSVIQHQVLDTSEPNPDS